MPQSPWEGCPRVGCLASCRVDPSGKAPMVPSMLRPGWGLSTFLALNEMTQIELIIPSSRIYGCRSAMTQESPSLDHPPCWGLCLSKQLVRSEEPGGSSDWRWFPK